MNKEEFNELMDELGIPKENIREIHACPFCNSDEYLTSSDGDSMTCFSESYENNLLVKFNTIKRKDTQDLYSMTAGFKIKYCPMCGRKL